MLSLQYDPCEIIKYEIKNTKNKNKNRNKKCLFNGFKRYTIVLTCTWWEFMIHMLKLLFIKYVYMKLKISPTHTEDNPAVPEAIFQMLSRLRFFWNNSINILYPVWPCRRHVWAFGKYVGNLIFTFASIFILKDTYQITWLYNVASEIPRYVEDIYMVRHLHGIIWWPM